MTTPIRTQDYWNIATSVFSIFMLAMVASVIRKGFSSEKNPKELPGWAEKELDTVNWRLMVLLGEKEDLSASVIRLRKLIGDEMRIHNLTITPPLAEMRTKYRRLYNQTKALEAVEERLARVELQIVLVSKRRKVLTGEEEVPLEKKPPVTKRPKPPLIKDIW